MNQALEEAVIFITDARNIQPLPYQILAQEF